MATAVKQLGAEQDQSEILAQYPRIRLRDFHLAELAHFLLARFLLFQKLLTFMPFSGNIAHFGSFFK